MLKLRLFLALVTLIAGASLGADASSSVLPAPQAAPVERRVWTELVRARDRRVTFVVEMRQVSGGDPDSVVAAQIGLREPLAALQRAGSVSHYTPYYGANAIVVTGTRSAVRFLAGWPAVAALRSYQPGEFDEPKQAVPASASTPAASGKFSGTVTGPGGLTPLERILVRAYRQTDPASWVVVGIAFTGVDGTYLYGGLPTGTYRAEFEDPAGNFVPEFYDDQSLFYLATNVDVTDGETTTGINASLAQAGGIAGTVTKVSNGMPVADIVVSVWYMAAGSWHSGGSVVTQSDGSYVVGGLAPGAHRVQFADPYTPPRYLDEYYDNVLTIDDATDVLVIAGATTPNIDAALASYGKITGTVTGPDGSTAISGIDVDVWAYNTTWMDWEWVSYGITDSSGDYEASGLSTEDYRVEFSDPLGQFSAEFYDDQTDIESGTDVHVELGVATPGVDASLDLAPMSVDLPFVADWNLTSLAVSPEDADPGAVLSPIDGNYERIWAYDGCDSTDPWKVYDPDDPASDLNALDEKQGYWLLATSPVTLTVDGLRPLETAVPLCVGWNLIGYPSGTSRQVPEVLAGLEGKYDLVYGYNAADLLDPWEKYDPDAPFGNDLEEMKPGFGYWVRMTQPSTLLIQSR